MARSPRRAEYKPKGLHSTPRRRNRIYGRYTSHQKVKEIADWEGVSIGHVYGVVKRFTDQDWGKSRPGRGRPKALDIHHKRRIIRAINANPFVSMEDLRRGHCQHVTATTLRRYLVSWKVKHHLSKTRPFLTEEAAATRYAFAREHEHKGEDFWRTVLFTDESTVERGQGARRVWVFRPQGTFSTCKYWPSTNFYGKQVPLLSIRVMYKLDTSEAGILRCSGARYDMG